MLHIAKCWRVSLTFGWTTVRSRLQRVCFDDTDNTPVLRRVNRSISLAHSSVSYKRMCVCMEEDGSYSKCHPKEKTSVHYAINGISGIRLRLRFFGTFSGDDTRLKGFTFIIKKFYSKKEKQQISYN